MDHIVKQKLRCFVVMIFKILQENDVNVNIVGLLQNIVFMII